MLGLSAAILMICSLGVNSISASDASLCYLIPGSVVAHPSGNMVCGKYDCGDGRIENVCVLRELIIN